jgi:hypothetical protein
MEEKVVHNDDLN